MAKITKIIDVEICDLCGKNGWYKCNGPCGRDYCSDCSIAMLKEYAGKCYWHDKEARYCTNCENILEKDLDPLLMAYRSLKQMIDIRKLENENWETKLKSQESLIEELVKRRDKK